MTNGFNINTFKASLARRGTMQTNDFQVYFPIPPGMQNRTTTEIITDTARELNLWCDAFEVPGVSWNTIGVRRFGYGPMEQVPTNPEFGFCMMRVINDAASFNWHFFREWQLMCMNFKNNKGVNFQNEVMNGQWAVPYETGYLEDYATNVLVSVFSNEGSERLRVQLREAWPVSLTPIKLAWDDGNAVVKFNVVFAMQDWLADFDSPTTPVVNPTDGPTIFNTNATSTTFA